MFPHFSRSIVCVLQIAVVAILFGSSACSRQTGQAISVNFCLSDYNVGLTVVDTTVFIGDRTLKSNFTSFIYQDSFAATSLLCASAPATLSLIRLDAYSVVRSIRIDSLKANAGIADELIAARYNADGSILAVTETDFFLIAQGKTLIIPIPGARSDEIQSYYIYPMRDFPPIYDAPSQTIRYGVLAYYRSSTKGAHYKNPFMEAELSLKSGSTRLLPVKRSPLNLHGDYGFIDNYYRAIRGDTTLYSFEADPNIYLVYDSTVTIIGGKSRADTTADRLLTRKQKQDSSEKLRQFVSVGTYSALQFNPFDDTYYRLYSQQMPDVRPDGLLNSIGDQRMSVQIFDTSLCLQSEIEIDPHRYSPVVLPHPEGLAVYFQKEEKDTAYTYSIIHVLER